MTHRHNEQFVQRQYLVNEEILERWDELIVQLQHLFLEIYSNHEITQNDTAPR